MIKVFDATTIKSHFVTYYLLTEKFFFGIRNHKLETLITQKFLVLRKHVSYNTTCEFRGILPMYT
jgi:hypothetical protein